VKAGGSDQPGHGCKISGAAATDPADGLGGDAGPSREGAAREPRMARGLQDEQFDFGHDNDLTVY